ncbi:MAG TPA: UbiD family decarboxylase [Pseudolabrys sp.]|nr:UbiD family decarboxylase [Pseudolabrys sp.]
MSTAALKSGVQPAVDVERFRLRRFVEQLAAAGELDVVREPRDLIDVAAHLDGNPKAVLIEKAGPEQAQIVGNVMGARRRLALAFGVAEPDLLHEVLARVENPIAPVEVASSRAPVHQVVLTGTDADFTRLPVHLQHGDDGAPYISASIDVTRSFDGKRRNVGYRRLMLRGRHEAGMDLVAPSDLRMMYGDYVKNRARMPVAFAVGSHPADGVVAACTWTGADELAVAGALRGAPVPLVRCATIDAWAPADAEMILEGYLDENGWHEPEGPYGEFLGYYGHLKVNPVFHLTAITMRRDALFQTATIGGRHLDTTDTAALNTIRTEAAAWGALRTAVREPVALYATPASGGVYNLRLSMRQRVPGEARNAIAAIFGSTAEVKHVFVVDDDVDIFSDAQMEWALATRFQADRDLVVMNGMRAVPLDPSLRGSRTGAKAGFDMTFPFGADRHGEAKVPAPPVLGPAGGKTVREALQSGPQSFRDLMEATGSRDGREVLLALDDVRRAVGLERLHDGRYALRGQSGAESRGH